MYANTAKVETSKGEVVVYDLTVQYLEDIENGTCTDDAINAIVNGTDLTLEEVKSLRKGDIPLLANAIMKLTYPESFDADGNLKQLPKSDDDGKKKA